jgi:hypothetical protein
LRKFVVIENNHVVVMPAILSGVEGPASFFGGFVPQWKNDPGQAGMTASLITLPDRTFVSITKRFSVAFPD